MGWTTIANITGPAGPVGPVKVSVDADNAAMLGGDGGIFAGREVIVVEEGAEPSSAPEGVLVVVVAAPKAPPVPLVASVVQEPGWRVTVLDCDGVGPWTIHYDSRVPVADEQVLAWPVSRQFTPAGYPFSPALSSYSAPPESVGVTITDSTGRTVTHAEEVGGITDFTLEPCVPPKNLTYQLRINGGILLQCPDAELDMYAYWMDSVNTAGTNIANEKGYKAWAMEQYFVQTGWREITIWDMNEPDPKTKITKQHYVNSNGTRTAVEDVPQGTVAEVLAWVGDDPVRAETAFAAETQPEVGRNRTTLLDGINKVWTIPTI